MRGYGFVGGRVQFLKSRGWTGGATEDRSGQEDRHHGEDKDNSSAAIFHQHDEPFIGLLVGGIIVAVGRRVGHFIVLRHPCLRVVFCSAVELPQSLRQSNGDRGLSAPAPAANIYLPASIARVRVRSRVRSRSASPEA